MECIKALLDFPFRYYILRERPSAGSRSDNIMEDIPMSESGEGALLGLPESETDLDVCENNTLCILFNSFHFEKLRSFFVIKYFCGTEFNRI